MKQFLRYILTLVAIFIATTNAWAECVIFNDGNEHQIMNWLSSNSTKTYTFDSPLPCGTLTFDIRLYWSATQGITVKATYSDGTSETILSNSRNSSNTVDLNSKKDIKSLSFSANGTERKWISNVKLTRRVSISASPNPITLAKTAIGETSAAETLTVTYSNIGTTQYVTPTSTADFTISPQQTSFDACTGTATYKITFHPQGTEGGERIATFTIVGRESVSSPDKASVTITAKGIAKGQPKHTWNGNTQYYVGDQINLPATWASSNTNTPRTYSVISHTESSEINEGATTPYINGSNQLILEKAGTLKIQMYQQGDDTYSPLTSEVTLTIVKRPTDFSLNFANEYFVDDEINKSTFFTNATNSEVTIQVSDKTADNRALFTYDGSVLKANGATLNADSETTTITITQPETYKWTGKTLTKEVIVKKYLTDFSWLLKDTYYVDDVITDIFTKSNNNLSSTITSSDPNIVKVEGSQLVALNAGKVTITISQTIDRKWTAFTQTKEITILKHNIVATITPDNAYWNELVSNPFAATSTHPVSGQVTKIDIFKVEQQGNEHIALMDANTRNIQTYYTNGDVNFLITRPEDYKYNALNQTLTLTVNANSEDCLLTISTTNVETGNGDNSTSGTITIDGIGEVLSFNYKLNNNANVAHYLTTQYSTSDNGDDFQDIAGSTIGEEDTRLLSHSLTLPTGTKRIRFKRTDNGWGDKRFVISNITVTRKQYLSITLPEVNNDTLFLPTVAINQPSTDTFNLAWSACSESILLVCDNSKFTIQPSVIQNADGSGNQTITVSCDPSELGTFTGKIFIYDQAQKDSIYVSCTINRKWTPIFSGTKAYNMQVDSTLTADFTYKDTYPGYPSEDPQAPFYYTIKHILDPNNHVLKAAYADKVITYDPITKQITAHNAGTAILALIQREIEPMADADGYFTDTLFCTITVSKRHTYFDVKTIAQCKTGDVFPYASLFNVFTNNDEVPMTFTSGDESIINYENDALHALCAGNTSFTIAQAESYKWLGHSQTLNINVSKYDSQFALTNNGADITCLIGDKIDALSLYTTANNEILPTITSDNPAVVSFNDTTRQLEANTAGEAIITISQPTDCKWTEYTATRKIIVQKHTPVFTFQKPVYFNDTVVDYFTTSNTQTALTIASQTDTDVAIAYFDQNNPNDLHTTNLISFNKEDTTFVTFTQEENWYWYARTVIDTIVPIDPNNHVTFTIDTETEMRHVFYHSHNSPVLAWDNGIQVGDWSDGFNYNDKTIVLHFTGIPDFLSFNTSIKEASVITPATDIKWYVKESIDGTNWSGEIWNNEDTRKVSPKIKLNPDTRYIMLCYSGNFGGVFHNITVTELNQFEAIPDTLNFGQLHVDEPSLTKTFDFKYANAGYKVHLQSTDTMFTVATTYIDTIGGEKYGTVKDIQVSYHPTHVHNTNATGAKIIIWDEAGHRDTVHLVANTIKSKPTLHWTEAWKADKPIVLLNQTVTNAAESTNGYSTVKYTSSDSNIIKVSDDGTSFQGVGLGEAIIIAYQDSDRVYEVPDPIQKTFLVTDKRLQYILWEDNLTDFCIDDEQDTLRAQVWVMTDAAHGTWEYSPEQTAKLQYSSPNVNIATVTDSILTIKGLGEMFLTATVPADTTYEMASAQIPVRVRDCSVQCTDADLIIPVINSDDLIMKPEDKLEYDPYALWGNTEKIVRIDTTAGIPGHLIFAYYGRKAWGTLEGKIRVFESTDGGTNWQQILSDADAVKPLNQQTQYSPYIPLSRNATHIKFERFDGVKLGYHILQYITITPAQYIESIPDDIDFGNVYLGNIVADTIDITYSSIRSNLQLASSQPSHLTIDKTTIEDECGAWDTIPLTITLKADIYVVGPFSQYVTVSDPISGITDTIHITANIVKNTPTITWNTTDTIRSSAEWETKKTAISSSGDQVLYEITQGNQLDEFAYLNDTGKMILLRGGWITARAYTAETTTSNEVSADHNFFIIVDPLFEDFSNDGNWLNANNWNIGRTPWATDSATIKANKHVLLTTEIVTEGLRFEAGSSIHITPTGGLSVGARGIQGAATDGSSIIIDNLKTGIGFLRISPAYKGAMPRTTVNYQTHSTLDTGANRDATWQYFGAPGNDVQFTVDGITWLYQWNEKQNWVKQNGTLTFEPFAGYAITQYGQPTYSLIAEPIHSNQDIILTKTPENQGGMNGDNLFANSYMAPIDVKNFTTEDFTGDLEKTFYIFNSGSWNQWNGQNEKDSTIGGNGATTPGQYCAIPALSAQYLDSEYDITTIPPMQGVYVIANEDGATIRLNYNKHVWQAGTNPDASTDMHEPMRAPQRQAQEQMQQDDFRRLRLQVNSANSGADRMYIIQESATTRDYDNGYDAPNQFAEGLANIYTTESFGKMEVSCANDIDSMYIGFQAGADNHYTLSFRSLIGDSLYLKDMEQNTIIRMEEGAEYHFSATPYTTNDLRFLLLLHPQLESDDTPTHIDQVHQMEIWNDNNRLYITNAPANSVASIYTVSGQPVIHSTIQYTTHTIDINHLQQGVYILRMNNQIYKFVCQ